VEGKNLFISRLREAYTYEKSVFVPEILRATGQVKIMQIRERNEEGMRRAWRRERLLALWLRSSRFLHKRARGEQEA